MAFSSTNGLVPHPPGMPAGFATPMRPSRTTEAITSSTMRSAQGSTPPTGPPSAHPSAPLTMDAVLETHATNPSPAYAGLETTISERNLLSSQNFQLWKLIEKQRSGYTSVLKDLERIRAERDAYKSALQSMGIDTESIRKGKGDPHRLKPSSSTAAIGVAGGASAVPARVGMVRHQSDDNNSRSSRDDSPVRRSPMNRRPSEDDTHPKRSQTDKARSRQDSQSSSIHSTTRSNSVPIHARNHSVETSRPASPPLPKAAEALNGLKGKVSPPPLVIPGRSDVDAIPSVSLSGATVDAQAPESTQPLQLPQYPNSQILTPASSTGTTGGPSPLSQFPLPPGNGNGFDPDNETRPHPSHNSVPSVGSFTTPQFLGANGSTTLAPAPHAASRESRIPLPDEAKLYIANMVDSPRPSPAANSESFDTDIHDDPRSAKTIQAPTRASDEDNVSSDADEESGIASGIDDTGSFDSHVSSADQLRTGAREDASQSATIRVPQRKSSLLRRNRRPAPNPPTAEVPSTHLSSISPSASALVDTTHASASAAHAGLSQGLHPSSAQSPYASQSSLQRDAADLSSTPDEIPRETSPSIDLTESITSEPPPPSYRTVSNANSSTSLPIDRDLTGVVVEKQSVQDADRKREKTPAGQPSFRELPLLASDLPHTTITVVNSTIKPNDRGKEVLSFIISVEPGNKKTGWKIEKLYSDVLTLDHRVRTTVGKTATKKIVTLPEGKLWKDHAPVRVDQRKTAMEAYLGSLIALPVKSKDEIVAFLTSDIIRITQQPVYQPGYKEGYLTKRGKNFGGWKSRYFVLQGPVLEYYESRGGTHLGSISITGAQIGRQQKTEKAPSDDDNEYRHAFLVIEAKKGPGGSNPRHVLCAQNDADRDSWVDVLVRYVSGVYNDDGMPSTSGQPMPTPVATSAVSKPSFDETQTSPVAKRPVRGMSKDNIVPGAAVPISQLAMDPNNAKLMQAAPYPDSLSAPAPPALSASTPSPVDRPSPASEAYAISQSSDPQSAIEPSEAPLSSSLPSSSPLEEKIYGQRSNSELGHYQDVQSNRVTPDQRQAQRKSYHPTLDTVKASPTFAERPRSPEGSTPAPAAAKSEGKVKISGPFKGAPIPTGFKFGTKDPVPSESAPSASDRREKAKSRSFWGFGGGRPNFGGLAGAEKVPVVAVASSPVFGVPLEQSLEIAEIAGLPAIVFRSIQYLEAKKADQEEGIYRLSGSSAVVKSLKDRFNIEGDVDLLSTDEFWDPHAIAGLLKSFLRELPSSILTRELHLQFLAVIDFVDPQERIRELSDLIARLPVANYSLLRALTAHLIRIVQNANVNKMTMRNVGIVFSPTLGIPAGVFSLMLGEFERVFNVNGEGAGAEDTANEAPDESVSSERLSGLDRRNSQRYTDAAADKLLGLSGRTLATPVESDEGDEISIQEESTDEVAELSDENAAETPRAPNTLSPTDGGRSKAQGVAASRGLNIATSPSADLRARRQSRMPGAPIVGLPSSPRPGHHPPSSKGSSPPASPNHPQQ